MSRLLKILIIVGVLMSLCSCQLLTDTGAAMDCMTGNDYGVCEYLSD